LPQRCHAHWGGHDDGGQGEYARVPQASGTLVVVPAGFDEKLIPSLLSPSDVTSTGYHAAKKAGIQPCHTVTVIGDGAVGLSAVLSAKLMGASRIVLMGRHRRNIILTGGVAPASAYIDELLPLLLDGSIEPGKVFDGTIGVDDVPAGYQAMADREALKVLVRP
jgi:threonine dehydrogenase-like Zn-dependent dehydrogenase